METVRTEVSAEIDAPPAEVYAIFADYRHAHPQILPRPYFGELVVEKGGQGAGTVFRTSITVMGMTTHYHMTVGEPEPGRVLTETDEKLGLTSFFIVEPLEGGKKSRVTIATDWKPKGGVAGWIEKLLNPGVMRRIYTAELQNIQEYVQKNRQRGGGGFE